MEQEHDNVRQALAWLIEHDPAIATQMTGALWRFWWTHGHLTEGRRWLTAALESGAGTTTDRARALYGLGSLAGEQGDYADASAALLESLALFREADDRAGQALALTDLGLIARDQGDLASAANRHNDALELRRELDDRRGIAISLSNLGIVAMNGGDFAAAESAFADAVRVFRELGDARSLATAVSTQADAAQRQGHFERAIVLGTESVGLLTEVGDRAAAAVSLVTLADCHRALGQTKSAIAYSDAALEHFRSLGHRRGRAATLTVRAALAMDMGQLPLAIGLIAESLDLLGANGDRFIRLNSLEGLARAAQLADLHDAATRLLSAVETQRSLLGAPRSPIREADRQALRADLIATLGRPRFDASWHTGSHVTWDELLRSADDLAHKLGTTSPPRAPAAAPDPELALDLTPRQIVVLTLIAEGCTNQQIADRLGITLLTAKTHVSRVLTSLDLPSRSAAAAVARRHGLI
ncbi:MAG: tetratricopeptide repeat protein [Thermomicrobiales bacterium]|nr:tetratricopeptide repeat protein [Thermomicrobiales bacterium]